MKHTINQVKQVFVVGLLNFGLVVLSFAVFNQCGVAATLIMVDLLVHHKTRCPISPFTAPFFTFSSACGWSVIARDTSVACLSRASRSTEL